MFEWRYYLKMNPDLQTAGINTEKLAYKHWLRFGKAEGRAYCSGINKLNIFIKSVIKNKDMISKLKINKFIYNPENNKTLLFIESRTFKHSEQLFRLFLYSVSSDGNNDNDNNNTASWNFTIMCTPNCKEFYENVCNKLGIVPKILILDIELKSVEDYNKFMLTTSTWELIKEENILLFQSDSIALGKFQNKFLEYDYIGAPWWKNVNSKNVGNGGTSFRKRSAMINCLQHYKPHLKKFPKSKLHTSFNKYKCLPEDVFYSCCLIETNGKLADKKVASLFSTEKPYCPESIYGHQMWLAVENFEEFISEKIKKMASC